MDADIRWALSGSWARLLERARSAQSRARHLGRQQTEFLILVRRLIASGVLIGLSLLLGISAQEQTREQGRKELETTNPPSLALWAQVLATQGYEAVTSPSVLRAVSRTHPGNWDNPGGVWITDTLSGPQTTDPYPAWISILSMEGDNPGDIRLFQRRDCHPGSGGSTESARPTQRPGRRRAAPRSGHLESALASPQKASVPEKWLPLGTGWGALAAWAARTRGEPALQNCPPLPSSNPSALTGAPSAAGKSDPRALRY